MDTNNSVAKRPLSDNYAALFTLSLRMVLGWTYFSAFWRRMILTNKLDPDAADYIGIKFNHFLPNALGIGPMIEQLVSSPDLLWWAMLLFTLIEGVVGLCLMLGLFTRLMALATIGLAMGVLLGAGWLGTTCLDEWQIGVLGIAAAFTIFLAGGGKHSMDLMVRSKLSKNKYVQFAASGRLENLSKKTNGRILSFSLVILFIALFTNQYFHNGLWGKLHNMSVAPKIEISEAYIKKDATLSFQVYRTEGVDVYGSFLIGISLNDSQGKEVLELNGEDLSHLSEQAIRNRYVAKVKAGAHSLIIPLGSKAIINLPYKLDHLMQGEYQLILTDISGARWTTAVQIP